MTAALAPVKTAVGNVIQQSLCPLCTARGQTWNGDPPTCGFSLSYTLDFATLDDFDREYYAERRITTRRPFQQDNWNCATLNALRDYAHALSEHGSHGYQHFRDDGGVGSFAVLIGSDAYDIQGILVMTWYKERGRVGSAMVMCDDSRPYEPNLSEALRFLRAAHHDATASSCIPEGWTQLLTQAKIIP